MAAGLMTGFGASTAFAQPEDSTDSDRKRRHPRPGRTAPVTTALSPSKGPQPRSRLPDATTAPKASAATMTADQALAIIDSEYAQGDGGAAVDADRRRDDTARSGLQAVECEQAGDRGRAGAPTQPDSARRGAEGDASVPAQAAGAVPACPASPAGGPVAGGRPGADARHLPAPGSGIDHARSASLPSCSTKNC